MNYRNISSKPKGLKQKKPLCGLALCEWILRKQKIERKT